MVLEPCCSNLVAHWSLWGVQTNKQTQPNIDVWVLLVILIQLVWSVTWALQFLYLLFFCAEHLLFHVSSILIIACWSIFVKAALKSLPGNSIMSVILTLTSVDCLLPFLLRFFLLLGMMTDFFFFLLKLGGYFGYYAMQFWVLFKSLSNRAPVPRGC